MAKQKRRKAKGPDKEQLKKLTDIVYLRAQLDLLSRQNQNQQNLLVRYAEAIGKIFAVSRPLIDKQHEVWPDVGEEGCELDKGLQQAIVAHRATIFGLIPKEGEGVTDDQHSARPGYGEGSDGPGGPTDPDAPNLEGEDGRVPAAEEAEEPGEVPAGGGAEEPGEGAEEADAPPCAEE